MWSSKRYDSSLALILLCSYAWRQHPPSLTSAYAEISCSWVILHHSSGLNQESNRDCWTWKRYQECKYPGNGSCQRDEIPISTTHAMLSPNTDFENDTKSHEPGVETIETSRHTLQDTSPPSLGVPCRKSKVSPAELLALFTSLICLALSLAVGSQSKIAFHFRIKGQLQATRHHEHLSSYRRPSYLPYHRGNIRSISPAKLRSHLEQLNIRVAYESHVEIGIRGQRCSAPGAEFCLQRLSARVCV